MFHCLSHRTAPAWRGGHEGGGGTNLGRETRTFEVGSASDVQRVQPLLQQLYTDQWKERADTDPIRPVDFDSVYPRLACHRFASRLRSSKATPV